MVHPAGVPLGLPAMMSVSPCTVALDSRLRGSNGVV